MANNGGRLSLLAQERSRQTHQNLLTVATRLWSEHGFDDVPVSEICRTAGVAKGTFYFYFARKEDLLIELGLSALDAVRERSLAALADERPEREVLDDALSRIAKVSAGFDRQVLRRMIEETLGAVDRYFELRGEHAGYREIFFPIIEAAQTRGTLEQHYTAENLATMLSWAVLQQVHQWASGGGRGSLRTALIRRGRIVWNGAQVAPD